MLIGSRAGPGLKVTDLDYIQALGNIDQNPCTLFAVGTADAEENY